MSTTARAYVCVRSSNGEVEEITPIWIGLSYVLYGLMVDVPGPVQLFKARGFPDGYKGLGYFDCEADGGYGSSWLDTQEMELVRQHLLTWFAENKNRVPTPDGWSARVGSTTTRLIEVTLGAMRAVDEWCSLHDPGGRALLVFYFE